jgi:molybdopterin synthase catalytic subunit
MGVVRNHNAGESAVAVDYDVHPQLALKALSELCSELTRRFPVKLWIVHSRGLVHVGEASVVIAASSAHRQDALTCVSDAIDALKVRVPIWKREIAPDASHRWLDGHSLRGNL